MPVRIALFRGVNVGGRNRLPMAELRELLENLGAGNVKTYIQSGNAVFASEAPDPAALARKIGAAVRERFGFRPGVLVISPGRVEQAIEANPFPAAEREPRSVHVHFLESSPADPDMEKLDALRAWSESYVLDGDRFYLHAPDGIARSKLAAGAEGALGVAATARNWRTVCKIRDMARSLDARH